MKCEKNHSNGDYSDSVFSRLERRREIADIPIDAELKRLQNDRNVFLVIRFYHDQSSRNTDLCA